MVNFWVAILIFKMEENMQCFRPIMLYYFKKGKNTTETQKKICAVCGEGAVIDRTSPSLRSFSTLRFAEISRWTVLYSQVHQLIAIKFKL